MNKIIPISIVGILVLSGFGIGAGAIKNNLPSLFDHPLKSRTTSRNLVEVASLHSATKKLTQSENIPSYDPVWVRGTLFGRIANPQIEVNEYGTTLLNCRAITVFLIGHYYGFGSGPAFISIKNRDLQLRYGQFPGFKGMYTDTFILGRYDGL